MSVPRVPRRAPRGEGLRTGLRPLSTEGDGLQAWRGAVIQLNFISAAKRRSLTRNDDRERECDDLSSAARRRALLLLQLRGHRPRGARRVARRRRRVDGRRGGAADDSSERMPGDVPRPLVRRLDRRQRQ